tara:strand:- start:404 stop:766 length:363 start_codon:yes stop_codon:yes gene_type:complete
MAEIVIQFANQEINTSLQIGDLAYYCDVSTLDGFNINSNSLILIGTVTAIGASSVTCSSNDSGIVMNDPPTLGSFVLFSKDNAVNMSSPLGYFAEVEFVNNDTLKSEMFATACDVFESSK